MLSGRAGSRGFGPAINYVLRELLISICGPQQCETAKEHLFDVGAGLPVCRSICSFNYLEEVFVEPQ